jgi:arginine utilization protein RocB
MFNGKQLQNLTKEELIEAYQETVGKACVNAAENIKWTYSQLWDEENLTLNDINKRLKTLTESELIKQATAKGIDLILDFHYRVKGGKCAINEVVAYNQRYNDIETLRKRFNEEEINFVNNLVDSGINFYVDYADSTIYDRQHGGVTIT